MVAFDVTTISASVQLCLPCSFPSRIFISQMFCNREDLKAFAVFEIFAVHFWGETEILLSQNVIPSRSSLVCFARRLRISPPCNL
jgi:hypothetical protein